jgi:hypothetical protein
MHELVHIVEQERKFIIAEFDRGGDELAGNSLD